MGDLPVVDLHVDRKPAVRTGVFNGDLFVFVVVAVDQQQKVDRSPHVEGSLPLDPHRMEIVAQRPSPRLVISDQGKSQCVARVPPEQPGLRHERQAALQAFPRDGDRARHVLGPRCLALLLVALDQELGNPLLLVREDVVVGTPEPKILASSGWSRKCWPISRRSASLGSIPRLAIANGMLVDRNCWAQSSRRYSTTRWASLERP